MWSKKTEVTQYALVISNLLVGSCDGFHSSLLSSWYFVVYVVMTANNLIVAVKLNVNVVV